MKICYVYEHYLLHSGEVFYVGKGSGYRASNKIGRSDYWKRKVSRFKWGFRIVKEFNNDWCAYTYEKLLIAKYGRKDLGTGQLVNLSNGGPSGFGNGKYGVVRKYDSDMNFIGRFRNMSIAAKDARVSTTTLTRLASEKKSTGGYYYMLQ